MNNTIRHTNLVLPKIDHKSILLLNIDNKHYICGCKYPNQIYIYIYIGCGYISIGKYLTIKKIDR